MKPTELAEQIDIEFEAIQSTVGELSSLRNDVSGRKPTVRELAAAGLFLANFYNGVENILKRANVCMADQASAVHEARILLSDDKTAYRVRSAKGQGPKKRCTIAVRVEAIAGPTIDQGACFGIIRAHPA